MRVLSLILIILALGGALAYFNRFSLYRELGEYLEAAEEPQQTDAIVVISGGGTERIEKGVELFKAGFAPLLIVSGAAAEGDVSNAKGMAAYAQGHGVPFEQIV